MEEMSVTDRTYQKWCISLEILKFRHDVQIFHGFYILYTWLMLNLDVEDLCTWSWYEKNSPVMFWLGRWAPWGPVIVSIYVDRVRKGSSIYSCLAYVKLSVQGCCIGRFRRRMHKWILWSRIIRRRNGLSPKWFFNDSVQCIVLFKTLSRTLTEGFNIVRIRNWRVSLKLNGRDQV